MFSRTFFRTAGRVTPRLTRAVVARPTLPRFYSVAQNTRNDNHLGYMMNNKSFSGNPELLNMRIYQEARLPQTQEEYELYEDIYNLIQERILPNIQEDGGNMEFRGYNFDEGIVYVKLTGACTSCSMSETTLKHGIEGMLTYFIPEVSGVKQVFDPEEEIAMKEFEKLERSLKSGN